MTADDLPEFPWTSCIEMTDGGEASARAMVLGMASVHEAITANSKLLIELITATKRRLL